MQNQLQTTTQKQTETVTAATPCRINGGRAVKIIGEVPFLTALKVKFFCLS